MATVEEISRHVAGVTASEDDLLLVATWVNQRWKEIGNTTTLKTLRRKGELVTQPVVEDGTVAVTRGSPIIVGTGTPWTSQLEGLSIRVVTNWYEIAQVTSATEIILASDYAENTQGSGAGYSIVNRRYRLDSEARQLGFFTHMRLRRMLSLSSEQGLDFVIPSRFSIANVPSFVAEVEPDENDVKQVEIYPYTRREELIHYIYWKEPPDLDYKDRLPSFIDIEAFREGVMVDVMRNAMFKAINNDELRKAEILRNDYRSQETRWMRDHKHRVIKQDSGAADHEFLLLNSRNHPTGVGSDTIVIDNAFDQVWYGRDV